MTTKLPGVGVVVGRFQVHELHAGHRSILEKAARHQKMVILVGVHPALVTRTDPLDFPTRKVMLESVYPQAIIIPLKDMPTDKVWSQNLDHLVKTVCPVDTVTIYAGRDSIVGHYQGHFPVKEIDDVIDFSGTKIRDQIGHEIVNSSDFRRGVTYASYNKYGGVVPTVDVALFKWAPDYPGSTHRIGHGLILLGKKKSDPDHWRFPGGFIDKNDVGPEQAAKRELYEETKLTIEGSLDFIGGFFVKDWRDTPETRLLTLFYFGEHTHGAPVASDDLDTVQWWPVSALRGIPFADDHAMLAAELLAYFKGKDIL